MSAKPVFRQFDDGSLVDGVGKVAYFSLDRFVRDIVEGDCCFLCGASPTGTAFNDEHVLPDWLLTRHGLHSQTINLPNSRKYLYGRYVLRCCKDCNSHLGKRVEQPVRKLVCAGYGAVLKHVQEEGPWLLFLWCALVYLKTHLKDTTFKRHPNPNDGEELLAQMYDWRPLHHIHCLVRSFYTGSRLDSSVLGSFLVLGPKSGPQVPSFDYRDFHSGSTVLLRSDDVCFIAVLDDSNLAQQAYGKTLRRVQGEQLTTLHLREVAANLAFISSNLITRPTYHSYIDALSGDIQIFGVVPQKVDLSKLPLEHYGRVLYHFCEDIINNPAVCAHEVLKDRIRSGRWTFLFDENGNFLNDQL